MSIPDTATVMATYATAVTYRQSPDPARQAAFRAWLAEHDRQVAQKAWDEAVDWLSRHYEDLMPMASTRMNKANPYENGAGQ